MTGRQRFLRAVRGDAVDRLPVVALEPYEPDGLARWRQQGLPADTTPEEHLGMDRLVHLPLSFFPKPSFQPVVLAEDEESYTTVDFMGPVVRRMKRAPTLYYGFLDHPVRDLSSWREYSTRFRAVPDDRLPPVNESMDTVDSCALHPRVAAVVRDSARRDAPVGVNVFPFFFRLGFYALGFERFLLAFYDQPDLIHEMFAFWSRFVVDTLSLLLPHVDVDFVAFNEDLAYKNATHLSLDIYEEFWLPYQDPVIEALHRWGVENICMWTAGNIESLIPILLNHGFNMIWPIERAAGMDPYRLRRRFGESLRMCGGFSKEALIGGPSTIDAETAYLLPLARAGGLVPALDDMVPLEVSLETYEYYVKSLSSARL